MNDDDVIEAQGYTLTRGEIRGRVTIEEGNIMLVRELSRGTAETNLVLLQEAREKEIGLGTYAMVIDLTETQIRPKDKYREQVMEMLRMNAVHVSFVLPANMVVRTVVRFFMRGLAVSASVHKTREPAMEDARRKLAEAV